MLLLDHDPGTEESSQCLNGPETKENAGKNESDAKGKERREETPHIELRCEVRQVEGQPKSHADDQDHEECAAAIAGAVSGGAPLPGEDPQFKNDPAPKAGGVDKGINC